jgi:hypothetical protein
MAVNNDEGLCEEAPMDHRQSFIAYYEDAAKVEAAAKKRGFTGNDGESWHDFVEAEYDKFRRSRQFWKLDLAAEWLKAEIAASKSVYGQGTILLQERVARKCSSCVCGGLRELHEYVVDDTGIVEDRAVESVCLD